MVKDKDFTVLDFFAGSGTTGHAVFEQNSKDSGTRKFILVEIDPNIASNIAAKRLKEVGKNYSPKNLKNYGFRYCELGATLFNGDGQIREEVRYNDLAQHIYFIETGKTLPYNAKELFPMLGVSNDTAIYLLYNGILKDKSVNGGNILTYDILQSLPEHVGVKVIYGNGCHIGLDHLRELGIIFKQIPYEIRER
jgi:site-specific DNA-methyltransferase (adenine-specific)/adenine-specific DNA-methyltransferase